MKRWERRNLASDVKLPSRSSRGLLKKVRFRAKTSRIAADLAVIVSYDINKDGYMVATLTLVKSAYRLGETVNGSVVINSGDGRVLRVSNLSPITRARTDTQSHAGIS